MPTNGMTYAAHFQQNISLVLLSFILLPLNTVIALFSLLVSPWISYQYRGAPLPGLQFGQSKAVLVTGVGMTKGLVLARMFHRAGHVVIGADFESGGALVSGRVSRAIKRFYSLTPPNERQGATAYAKEMLRIIRKEKIDLWVSCSGVASAIQDAQVKEVVERETDCKSVQFDLASINRFHEKDKFMDYIESLGMPVPETYTVTSRAAIDKILASAGDKRFILKTVGLNDAVRGDMTLFPRPEPSKTEQRLINMDVSPSKPWIVQQFIRGSEFCTHALVIRGRVRAFVSCPSSDMLMNYVALPSESALSLAMLKFTQTIANKNGPEFSGHLSFDFLIEDTTPSKPEDIILYPIECNPRAHTAVALFNESPRMIDAYLSLVEETVMHETDVVVPHKPQEYYWSGHQIVDSILLPLIAVLRGRTTPLDFLTGIVEFMHYLFNCKDGTFEFWDPLPWWWLYHIYWPMRFLNCILRTTHWSKVNVSTGKIFEA